MSLSDEAGDIAPLIDRLPAAGHSLEGERRVPEVVEEFLERLLAGESPDSSEIILAHPDLAAELEWRLIAVEDLYRLGSSGRPDHAAFENFVTSERTVAEPIKAGKLGRYTIQGVLGRGSSSVVFLAHDPKLDREVALKVFRYDPTEIPDIRERFERDARIAAKLRHPNIVPLHEANEHDGLCYIDSELIRGETLEARLQARADQAIDPSEAAELVRKIAGALDYAHTLGIVHRDIKPSNILIDERGEPQLTDFGLARSVGGRTLTIHGQVLGTPAYMSPEQAEGRAHEADGRSDVYSLAVMLYRMLTGKLPFQQADSLSALLAQIASQEPPSPRSLNPAISRDLETICLKAMEKRPSDRFASAGAFADELRRWFNREPLTVRPPTRWERLRRWSRRNRVAARVALLSALLLAVVSLILGTTAWIQALRAREARFRHAVETRYRAETQVRALILQAQQRLRTPTQGRRFEAQKLLRDAGTPLRHIPDGAEKEQLLRELRSAYAATLGVPDFVSGSEDTVRLPDVFYQSWRVALHPDGKSMAIGTHLGPIRWVRGERPNIPAALDKRPARPRLAYTPDGRYLVVASTKGGLELWDGAITRILATWRPRETATVLAVGFREQTLWAYTDAGLVQSFTLPGLQPVRSRKVSPRPGTVTAAAFSRDATRLAVGDETGQVRLQETTGHLLGEWPADRIRITALAWSPDHQLVASGTTDGTVKLWNTADGTLLFRWPAFPLEVESILFGADGRWLLAGSRMMGATVWDAATGHQIVTTGSGVPLKLSEDERTLAAGSTVGAGVGDFVFPQAIKTLTGHRSVIERLAWSRDNRHVVSLDNRFEVRVWDIGKGVLIDEFRPPQARDTFFAMNAAVALSDDGKLVAYASGGMPTAHALIRHVTTRRTLAQWDLPDGFDRMTYADGRFLLVREELDEGKGQRSRTRRTVARALEVGRSPDVLRIIRPAEGSEEEGFFTSALSPDGRLYLWVGPREPDQNWRVEVREVATGRLIRRIGQRDLYLPPEPLAILDPHRNDLWIRLPGRNLLVDLQAPDGVPKSFPGLNLKSFSKIGWVAIEGRIEPGATSPGLVLHRPGETASWIEFVNEDLSGPGEPTFSPDGRFLAWSSQEGTITVANLHTLEREVKEFETTILAP